MQSGGEFLGVGEHGHLLADEGQHLVLAAQCLRFDVALVERVPDLERGDCCTQQQRHETRVYLIR